MPTHDHKMGTPIDLKRTGTHPLYMMLYALDELFYMFCGIDTNDIDGQHVIAYSRVVLSDVNSLECLAWAMYDGVFVPGDSPVLTGHHD